MKSILLATRNSYKKKQFEYLLSSFNFNVKILSDYSFTDDVVEDAKTARGNALIKARFWAEKTKLPTLADDAGLEIDVLDGAPGVKARRWGGFFNDSVDDETWLNHLLKELHGVPFEKRTARYRAAWALVIPGDDEHVRDVVLDFFITEKPMRPYPSGSPMSAVRYFSNYQKVEVELTEKEQWSELLEKIQSWNALKMLSEK